MILHKWNYENHTYDEIEKPDGLNFKTYSDDMNEIINCPHCLKELKYGDSYTSHEYQTLGTGFGYGVCEQCYEDEIKRRKTWE